MKPKNQTYIVRAELTVVVACEIMATSKKEAERKAIEAEVELVPMFKGYLIPEDRPTTLELDHSGDSVTVRSLWFEGCDQSGLLNKGKAKRA